MTPTQMQIEILNLPLDQQDFFQERAAIIEYDGNTSREDAERQALLLTKKLFKGA